MAESPAHRWGQILGDLLESALLAPLEALAGKHGLYLDRKQRRGTRRGVKCSWTDRAGNVHDLDYVLERGGSDKTCGTPVAFIETAWRRYTKHSRAKAQEIEGAILPLAETYDQANPFLGLVLSGEWTADSLKQLRSRGFKVLEVPESRIVAAFRPFGIDPRSDESTPDAVFREKVRAYGRLSPEDVGRVRQAIIGRKSERFAIFFAALESSLTRRIVEVRLFVVHGRTVKVSDVAAATQVIETYKDDAPSDAKAQRYEIAIRYSNGDEISGAFETKPLAVGFLRRFAHG